MEKNWEVTPSATLKLVCPVNLVNRLHDNNRKQVTGYQFSPLRVRVDFPGTS